MPHICNAYAAGLTDWRLIFGDSCPCKQSVLLSEASKEHKGRPIMEAYACYPADRVGHRAACKGEATYSSKCDLTMSKHSICSNSLPSTRFNSGEHTDQ